MDQKNTNRFGNRVEDYVKYRPGYPGEIVDFLTERYSLTGKEIIADIGSGTGLSALPFLEKGFFVKGIEPNKPMRDKSIELLGSLGNFATMAGTAEDTGLPDNSTDVIVCGQAFHWFDRSKAKTEFLRILKPSGLIVLIWNERLTSSDFEHEYDQLIFRHAFDYIQVDHRNIDMEKIAHFFAPAKVELTKFNNRQVFNFEGLLGRLLSSSYMPHQDHQGFNAMKSDLGILFSSYADNGKVTIHYETKVFSGRC